jgi:hypothetical protein
VAQVARAEEFLKRRIPIGTTVKASRIQEEATGQVRHRTSRSSPHACLSVVVLTWCASGQGYSHPAIVRAVNILVRRGDLLERDQGRVLKRIK